MTDTKIARRRRMAREPQGTLLPEDKPKARSRLDQLEQLLLGDKGASLTEMTEATGWQQHSVRGAMAGALKRRRGLVITSERTDGMRRYRARRPA